MMDDALRDFMRSLPRMDDLLTMRWVEELETEIGREAVKNALNDVLDDVRRRARDGSEDISRPSAEIVEESARALLERRAATSIKRVINATGVVVHTNLGRSPIAESAARAAMSAALSYSNLEYSLEAGVRGSRNSHIEWLIRELTGAEAALAVNNNAGAVLLALAGTASGHEVIVSAGELVEIGGSFRIPEILSFSRAKAVVVGCTNCTHLRDYRDAITPETSVILKVHPSNYSIDGFTDSVGRTELAALAHEHGLTLIEDLGSGLIEPLDVPGAAKEATARECIESGVDIVTFSGDKLLGGPQIGVIAGRLDLIAKMRSHQLLRALRVDKMTLAAFEETLRLYLKGESASLPTVAMLRRSAEELKSRADSLARRISDAVSSRSFTVRTIEADDAVGGGAYPTAALPGWAVEIRPSGGISPEKLAARLRTCRTPIVAGIRDGAAVIHTRTLLDGDDDAIASALKEIYG